MAAVGWVGGIASGRQVLGRSSSLIATQMGELHKMLEKWTRDIDGPWALLGLYKSVDFNDPKIMEDARTITLQLECGVAKEFEDRYGIVLYKLECLYDPAVSDDVKADIISELLDSPSANFPVWLRDFITMSVS